MEQHDEAVDVQIRRSELLAQKLYGQCRDSSSAFKTLSSSLRKLRNVLEEIDEALERSDETAGDGRLVHRAAQCRAVLERVDVAFTSWKCNSSNDIEPSVATRIRSDLEMITHDLSEVHESMARPAGAAPSASSSQTHPNSFSDEKEVWQASHDRVQSSVASSARSSTANPDFTAHWSALFAQADPLSMPLREASRSILRVGSPDAPSTTAQSEAADVEVHNGEKKLDQEESGTHREVVDPVATPSTHSEDAKGIETVADDAGSSSATNSENPGRHDSNVDSESSAPPRSPPPPPPPPRRSVQHPVTVVRPPSPAPSDGSDDLYSSTPPRRASPLNVEEVVAQPKPPTAESANIAHVASVRAPRRGLQWLAAQAEGPAHVRSMGLSPKFDRPESYELEGDETPMSQAEQLPAATPRTPTITVNAPPPQETNEYRFKPKRYRGSVHKPPRPASMRERASSTGDLALDVEKTPALQTPTTGSRPTHRRSVDEALLKTHMAFIKQHPTDVHPPSAPTPRLAPLMQENLSPPPLPPRPPTFAPAPPRPTPQYPVTQAPSSPPSTRRFPAPQAPAQDTSRAPWAPDFVGRTPSGSDGTYYSPDGAEAASLVVLDEEYTHHIVHFFNNQRWAEAGSHLTAWLESLQARSEIDTIRRVQHLLGVVASLQGQWLAATRRFINVLKKPVMSALDLDDGDCAAAYWLGDLYAMQNRRADAFLAYAIAERSAIPNRNPNGILTLSMEQQTVQVGLPDDYELRWAPQPQPTADSPPSLTDPTIISVPVAKLCLENVALSTAKHPPDFDNTFYLNATRRRADYLTFNLTGLQVANHERSILQLTPATFSPTSPWPIPHDPFFSIANVARGRLLAYECDMLAVLTTNPSAKLPRPLLSKLDYFTTSHPLPWLITTIRDVLQTLEVGYSEVVNVRGTWFCCRHSRIEGRIATTNYFSIKLVRLHMRGSYGVDVMSDDGLGSARILNSSDAYDRGVHVADMKRLRKIIRECLEEAARERKKTLGRGRSRGRKENDAALATSSDLELVGEVRAG